MKSFPTQAGPRAIVGAALVILALAVAVPIVWKRPTREPSGSSTAPSTDKGAPSATPASGPRIFRFYQEAPTTLDPALAADAYSSTVIAQIYSPLVGLTSNLEPTPQVADSWTISRDGTTYVFHIREGVRFHNGRKVTAEDFAYTLTRCFREPFRSEGLAAGYLDAIDGVPEFLAGKATTIRGIHALDENRLEIRLSRPYRPLLSALALDQTSVVPRELMDRHGNAILEVNPVGCGPFRYVRRDDHSVVLAANPDYFMGAPAIDSLVFYTPTGDVISQGANALLDGRATLSTLPIDRVEEFRAQAGITMLRWQDLTLAFLGMNATIPPLDDRRVRQALALAVDRQAMIHFQPEGKTLATGILAPGVPGYTPATRTYPRDLARAKELLRDAGYGPAHPLPTLKLYKSVTSNAGVRALDSLLVRSVGEAGFKVDIQYVTWKVLDDAITGRKAQLFSLSWVADIPDPDTFLRALFYSSSSTNYFRYRNATVDSLLDRARSAEDPKVAQAAYQDAEQRILRDAPFVPLFHPTNFIGLRSSVVGLQMNPLGISTLAMEKLRFAEPKADGDTRSAAR
jgi:oligopeptide transport system substrate-binding protein